MNTFSSRFSTRAIAAAFALTLGLSACGTGSNTGTGSTTGTENTATGSTTTSDTGDANAEGKPVVLTTFTVLADIARNVAGEHLHVESLTKVGAEIHGYEPTPGDLRKVADADLVLNNGLNLEVWFDQFMSDAKAPRITVSTGIQVLNITADAYTGKPNPHAWMSPVNVKFYVDNMVAAFSELSPQHRADFEQNAQDYKAKLDEVQAELTDGLAGIKPEQRVLVTCEGAFSYLAKDAGLEEAYIWPVNAENQATPQQIANTIAVVNDRQIPAVFCESTVANDPMLQVVEATDAKFGGVLYVDSLSLEDGPVPTYLDLIQHDVTTIVDNLTKN